MGKKLQKLIDVKSIVTLTMTAVFAVLSLRGDLAAEHFMTVFTTIIAFYFGTQYRKSETEENGNEHSND